MTFELEALALTPYDVLVVGGGIVGAGVARDAALRGLRAALVEQYDFAFGTSSRSSRLLHGGLRYLAQGRVGLVYEASKEKALLGHLAPHLCEPLPFLFPTRRGTQWQKWKLHIGVKVYDWMTGDRKFAGSKGVSREEVLEALPGLNDSALTGAVHYYDALTNDARLVIDTLRSASIAGAELRSYTRLVEAMPEGKLWRCEVADQATGDRVTVRARAVVNATGAWSDHLAPSETHLRPTKGVHLVVRRERLPIGEAAVVMTEGPRILFAIPWGERVILGTTDTDYDGPLEIPGVTAADRDYVLGVVNATFPEVRLGLEDVCSEWSGLRPLVAQKDGAPSDISREHEISQPHPGWWDITGGKLTTYRLMAEQAVDRLVAASHIPCRACTTAERALLEEPMFSGVVPPPVCREAVHHYCQVEAARHLDDVMVRRAGWRHFVEDQEAVAITVAGWMAEALGWRDESVSAELARYRRIIREDWYEPQI